MTWRVLHWAERQSVKPCGAKFCLVMLANWAQGDGLAWGSQARLAEATDQSETAVRKHLKALEAAGYIARYDRRDQRGQRKGDGYVLDPENTFGLLEVLGGERDVSAPGKLKSPVDGSVDEPVDAPVDGEPNRQNQAVGPTGRFDHPNRQNPSSQPADSAGTYSNAQSSPSIPPIARARDPAVESGDAPAPSDPKADPWSGDFPGVKTWLLALGNPEDRVDAIVSGVERFIARKLDLPWPDARLIHWALLREVHREGRNGVPLKDRVLAKVRGARGDTLLLRAKAAAEQHKYGGAGSG